MFIPFTVLAFADIILVCSIEPLNFIVGCFLVAIVNLLFRCVFPQIIVVMRRKCLFSCFPSFVRQSQTSLTDVLNHKAAKTAHLLFESNSYPKYHVRLQNYIQKQHFFLKYFRGRNR